MDLHRLLRARAAENRPVPVGLIGCGKFASIFLAQVPPPVIYAPPPAVV
jgi:predicted homoserine dehydrogenase-like protein